MTNGQGDMVSDAASDESAFLDNEALPWNQWYVLADDLLLRGFSSQDLRQEFRVLGAV